MKLQTISGAIQKMRSKRFLVILLLVGIVSFAAIPTTFAATTTPTNWYSCLTDGGGLGTCMLQWSAIAANKITAIFVALGAYLVQLTLQFNANLLASPAIQVGFSVSLAIANLGFVLGIIIIALATILRNQTYGVKQLLGNLSSWPYLSILGLWSRAPL